MGIRVSGKLGSGTDIKQANVIFEKNQIIPLRRIITDFINGLIDLAKVPAIFEVNSFNVINDEVPVITENDKLNKFTQLPQNIQDKLLNSWTLEELLNLVKL